MTLYRMTSPSTKTKMANFNQADQDREHLAWVGCTRAAYSDVDGTQALLCFPYDFQHLQTPLCFELFHRNVTSLSPLWLHDDG